MDIDLHKLRDETQAKCDDASSDVMYVSPEHPTSAIGGCSAILDPDDDEATQRRIGIVCFALVASVVRHRANGGIGQGKVWFTLKDNILTGHHRFLTNSEQLLDFLRESDANSQGYTCRS